jgi:predicted negative regulator of RcsB-dependent stress response
LPHKNDIQGKVMALDLQEQDELDNLKAFWAKYGNLLMTVITVLCLAFAAWRGWNYYQAKQAGEAAALYEVLRAAASSKDLAKVKEASGNIFEKFSGTPYAQMAALVTAKSYFEANDLKAAKAPLEWAVDKAQDEEFRVTARLRLAAILIDEKAYDQASKHLQGPVPKAYTGQFADARGDLLVAQSKLPEAKLAYKEALEALAETSAIKRLVKVKLDALAGAGV